MCSNLPATSMSDKTCNAAAASAHLAGCLSSRCSRRPSAELARCPLRGCMRALSLRHIRHCVGGPVMRRRWINSHTAQAFQLPHLLGGCLALVNARHCGRSGPHSGKDSLDGGACNGVGWSALHQGLDLNAAGYWIGKVWAGACVGTGAGWASPHGSTAGLRQRGGMHECHGAHGGAPACRLH